MKKVFNHDNVGMMLRFLISIASIIATITCIRLQTKTSIVIAVILMMIFAFSTIGVDEDSSYLKFVVKRILLILMLITAFVLLITTYFMAERDLVPLMPDNTQHEMVKKEHSNKHLKQEIERDLSKKLKSDINHEVSNQLDQRMDKINRK